MSSASSQSDPYSDTQEPSFLQRWFTEHPADVDETYLEHLTTASSFAGGLAVCAFCCFVHALVPGLFTTSASARVECMVARMHNRGSSKAS